MRKLVLGLAAAPLAYLFGAALLHYVVLVEGPIPDEAYPRPGAVYSSDLEGVDSHIIRMENASDLKRVRVRPGAVGPPEHVHVELEEKFHLLEGELVVVLDGTERIATAGEWVVVPPLTPHRFFNRSDSPAVYEITAPREHNLFTSQLYGLTNEQGSLSAHPARALLQMSRFHPTRGGPLCRLGCNAPCTSWSSRQRGCLDMSASTRSTYLGSAKLIPQGDPLRRRPSQRSTRRRAAVLIHRRCWPRAASPVVPSRGMRSLLGAGERRPSDGLNRMLSKLTAR